MESAPPDDARGWAELNALLETILDSTTDAVALIDRNDRVRYVNRRLRQFADLDPDQDYVGRPVDEVLPRAPELLRRLTADVLNDGRPRTASWHEPVADLWLETTIAPAGNDALVVTEDRTESRLAEARERQWVESTNRVDRLDALGRMAGGIAHDVGNLMRLALSGLADAVVHIDHGGPARAGVDDATRAVERALAVAHQLLVFSRGTDQPPRPTNLDAVVDGVETLIGRTLGDHIELVLHLGAGGATIESDPNRLEQMILNLANNAGRAMPDGGQFAITTSVVDAGPTTVAGLTIPHVQLVASDTGAGMSPEVAERAFEPFFTTDPIHGTGLGLASVYGTAVAAGGSAEIDSTPGEGTRVTVRLPVISPTRRQRRTVLLVDTFGPESDDTLQTLTAAGFDVKRLTPARVVAEIDRNDRYDALVLDPAAEGGAGRMLTGQLRSSHPTLPIVLLSGRTSYPQLADDPFVRFVPPPYGRGELAGAVVDAAAAVDEP